jgi:hypothetical protein
MTRKLSKGANVGKSDPMASARLRKKVARFLLRKGYGEVIGDRSKLGALRKIARGSR